MRALRRLSHEGQEKQDARQYELALREMILLSMWCALLSLTLNLSAFNSSHSLSVFPILPSLLPPWPMERKRKRRSKGEAFLQAAFHCSRNEGGPYS